MTIDEFVVKLNNLPNKLDDTIIPKALEEACQLAENSIKNNAKGSLKESTKHYIEDNVGTVYNDNPHAIFNEFGTGIYNALTNGRSTYWVYVKNGDPSLEGTGAKPPYYTLEEAKQRVAILRKKGLDAYYTQGQLPTYFFTIGWQTSKDAMIDKINEVITKELLK